MVAHPLRGAALVALVARESGRRVADGVHSRLQDSSLVVLGGTQASRADRTEVGSSVGRGVH